jgi:hypothetical protein
MSRSVVDRPLVFSKPIRLRRRQVTSLSIRYDELDDNGTFLPNQDDGVIGRFHVHKWALGDTEAPEFLSIFIVKE